MPVNCSTIPLSGSEGRVTFRPPATEYCLKDYSDFAPEDTTQIKVPGTNDFRIGDPVSFTEEGSGNLDSALDPSGSKWYVVGRDTAGNSWIEVSATKGGTAVEMDGDGGLGAPTGGVVSALTAVTTLPTTSGNYSGTPTGLATTTNSVNGSGLTVTPTISSSNVQSVAVVAGGTGYVVGDQITIDGALMGGTSGTDDVVFTVATASAVSGGGNTPGEGNHIKISYAEDGLVCLVESWNVDFTRDSQEVTTLSCSASATAASKYAPFSQTIPTTISSTGSMTVLFVEDSTSLTNRLMMSSLLNDQQGAYVKFYMAPTFGADGFDDDESMVISGPITMTGFSVDASADDVLRAEVQFAFSGTPDQILYEKLS